MTGSTVLQMATLFAILRDFKPILDLDFCDLYGEQMPEERITGPKIGGMAKNITESVKSKIYYKCKEYEKLAKEQIDYLIPIFENKTLVDGTELPEKLGYHDFGYIATHPTYGDRTKIDQDNVVEYAPFDVYDKDVAIQASTTIPTLNGRLAEVGPRARFNKFFDFKEKGAMAIHVARAYEMIVHVKRALEIIDELNVNGKTLADEPITGDGEKVGLSVHEAARGHNTHQASIDKNGRITYYNAIVATTWNIPLIGKQLKEVIINLQNTLLGLMTRVFPVQLT